jgi:ergothioneine biosynthesis protein EgtB
MTSPTLTFASALSDPATVAAAYREVRAVTEALCRPLATEDYVLQAMPDVSPTKWHLAHVSWFFETFILERHLAGYQPLDPAYRYLFNSYYNRVGPQYHRPHRGLLSRPTVAEIYAYRAHVDRAMARLLREEDGTHWPEICSRTVLGLHHEQQHQELILTDIKYNLSVNPLRPAYRARALPAGSVAPPWQWVDFAGGLQSIGHEGDGFAFDNETPRHLVYLQPYRLASRPVTNGEYVEFIAAGGYAEPRLWLSEGWRTVQERGWTAPLYWEPRDGQWWSYTVAGMAPLDPDAPVTHVSYFEADAYARFRGARLPTEHEWEHAAAESVVDRLHANFLDDGIHHPVVPTAEEDAPLVQLLGDVWEWTQSPYTPYPGFRPQAGDVEEYNGKFMVNQMVLRGGSCATPRSHIRLTYRNFFPPDARWQFMGLRLAQDV